MKTMGECIGANRCWNEKRADQCPLLKNNPKARDIQQRNDILNRFGPIKLMSQGPDPCDMGYQCAVLEVTNR